MAELQEYKCPNCGGALEFNSSIQKMKCPYCDTELNMDSLQALDEALKNQADEDLTWTSQAGGEWESGETDNMSVYVCKSCGGEIVADESTAATSCPFCDNPVVMMGRFSGDLKPDYVIPFKLDKKAAKEKLSKHLVGKILLPKVFKDQNHIDEVKGLYVPFWLFDTEADADIQYQATRVRSWSDKDYNYTETNYFSVLRSGQLGFERIPVDGSSKLDNQLMESIEPFDFSEAVNFQTAYLAGYLADKYDVGAEESLSHANRRVKQSTETVFANTVTNFDTVVAESSNIRLKNGSTKYVLYPVWILNTTWNGKKFVFAMNGQTGKFVGDLPLDKQAYRRWLIGIGVAASLVSYAVAWLINLL
ncbi:zinc finger domain, LSD1 subclass [Streptococcus sinensis]|uniref:Primosomal protein N' (Replication factor Y)-superfamily II helicase n=1 Tax=Streptococcus sinensis TaxID=176090 RepID=A0A0A0DJY4_9STRE|nr:zinc finger domain, LSD1 subclass [Streptococcus sinensis]KGM37277.1 Primosomal protein N' (replication factor Y) - superfamily II helicase [Streptococcus sinensis]